MDVLSLHIGYMLYCILQFLGVKATRSGYKIYMSGPSSICPFLPSPMWHLSFVFRLARVIKHTPVVQAVCLIVQVWKWDDWIFYAFFPIFQVVISVIVGVGVVPCLGAPAVTSVHVSFVSGNKKTQYSHGTHTRPAVVQYRLQAAGTGREQTFFYCL